VQAAVTGAALPSAAWAQPDPYSLAKVADSIYAVVRKTPTSGASDANVLIVIRTRDVVVVDANIFPSSTRQVIAEIRKLTSLPVRYVVNTHWHDDHLLGNNEYRKAYPGVAFISHPFAREAAASHVTDALARNVREVYPADSRRVRDQLASGKRRNGDPLSGADSAALRVRVQLLDFFVRDLQGTPVIPADITVSDSLTLHDPARDVVIKWIGLGNTEGDLIVFLPRERIVASGDLVVHPIPFGYGSIVPEWSATLRTLKQTGATTLVPGHGPILRDWTYVDRLIAVIESVGEQVARAVAGGADLEGTRKLVDLSAFRDSFAGSDDRLRSAFDNVFATPIVEAAFERAKAGGATRKKP
jgi:glyoxylase-like metal-dependent hydrolase (beta-lactamase superfamily II)